MSVSEEYPEHLRGDMYYENPPIPDRNGKHCVTQDSIPTRDKTCATEPLSGLAAELLSDTTPPEFMIAVWESAQKKTPPAVASRYYLPSMRLLVMLCRELQVAASDGTFFLACRHAAFLTGINYRTASRCLAKLEKDKVLERVSTGTVKLSPTTKAKANEYRYLGGKT